MDENRPVNHLWSALLTTAFPCVAIMLYVVGYLYGSTMIPAGSQRLRCFTSEWTCLFYCPAARLEANLAGVEVILMSGMGTPEYDVYTGYRP